MPILNIRDMGLAGVNSDIAPWELPPAALNAGINFRMSNGKIQSAGGIDIISPNRNDQIGHITNTRSYDGSSRWLAMGRSGIYLLDAGKWTDLSAGTSFVNVDESLWSSCQIGNVTFMNHPDVFPYYWIDAVDTLGDPVMDSVLPLPWHIIDKDTVVTWEEAGKSCSVLSSHKNFLFALGMKEFEKEDGSPGADVEYRDKVWWSHPCEPNGIPFSWRPTIEEPSSIAGYVNLGRGGKIIGGESLRDSFVIYSEDAMNAMDYVGDALGWRRRTVSANANLMGKEGVVEVKGQHYFIGRDDILAFDGNTMQSIVHNRLRTRLAANVNNNRRHKSWAAHYETFNEVWFAVPSATAEFPDLAYVFNYRDNTWGVRHLEEEFKHGAFGDQPSDLGNRTWDTMVSSWDDDRGSWAMGGESPFAGALLGCRVGYILDLDPGVSTYQDSTSIYRVGDYGDFSGWTYTGNPVDSNGKLIWDFRYWDDGVNEASASIRDMQIMTAEPPDKVRVFAPVSCTFSSSGGNSRIKIFWNDVLQIDEVISGRNRVEKEFMFEVPMGERGDFRFTFTTHPSLLKVGLEDCRVEYLNTRTETLLSRSDLPIGGHDSNTTITRIYPLVEGTSPLQIRVGSAQRAGGPIRWAGGFRTFTPGVDRKIDVRTTGETHAYEIKSSGRAFFDLTGMDIEFSPAGGR
jgi:hypothetical protein